MSLHQQKKKTVAEFILHFILLITAMSAILSATLAIDLHASSLVAPKAR
jgi:hypothetical protein